MDNIIDILWQCWMVLGEMAPYLLFGFLMAGLLSIFVSPEWVERNLGRGGFGPVLKATLIGIPMPLCSCGVIPVAASIRRHGASRAATTSFLLSTPQTGVDSIFVTYSLLGLVFAVFRPIAALITGLLGGGLVMLFDEKDKNSHAENHHSNASACNEECCADRHSKPALLRGLHYGLVTLPRDIAYALLIGIVIAGLITALTPTDTLKPYLGGGIASMLLMILVGVPTYVCASASVPIAAGFIHLGVSPGAALAFLIAGPATNAATIATVWKTMGKRTTIIYLLTIVISALGCGLLLDAIFSAIQVSPPHLGMHDHATAMSLMSHFWAVLLLAVLGYSVWSSRKTENASHTEKENETGKVGEMNQQRIELTISGMTCGHCVASVKRALSSSAGVSSAEVTLKPPRAIVQGEHIDPQRLLAVVAELGYNASLLR
jgi:uncharacterized protein